MNETTKKTLKKWVIRLGVLFGIAIFLGTQVRPAIQRSIKRAETQAQENYKRQVVHKTETVFLYPGDVVYLRVNPKVWKFEPQDGQFVEWIGLTKSSDGGYHPIYQNWILDKPNDGNNITRRMAPHHIIGLRYPSGSNAKFVAVVVRTTLPRNEKINLGKVKP